MATNNELRNVLRNKKAAETIWTSILNDVDVDKVASMMSPDYTYNGSPTTAAANVAFIKQLHTAAENTYFRLEGLIGAHNTVALRWTLTADRDGASYMLTGENVLAFTDDGLLASNWQSMGSPTSPTTSSTRSWRMTSPPTPRSSSM